MKKRALSLSILVLSLYLIVPETMRGADGSTGGPPPAITGLEQVIQLALDQNPAIQAAESAWKAAQQDIPVAAAWPEPTLSLVQFLEPVETRNGPQQQQIGINQMLPLWGTIGLKRSISMQKARKAQQDYEAARIRVVSRVKSVWADLYWLDRSLRILDQYQDVVRTFRDIAEVRYSTGKGMQTSVLKARLEISTLEEKSINFRKMRQAMAHQLNGLINRPIDAPILGVDSLALPDYTLDETALLALLGDHRQDLLGLRALLEANRTMIDLQSKKNLPMIGVGINYITIGTPQIAMGAPKPAADALAIMARVELPLWFGANKARVERAKLGLATTQFRYADQRNTAESEVRTAHFKVLEDKQSLALYRTRLIPEAEQTLNSALSAYKTGSIGFLDLLDAERMIVQLKLNYSKEQANYYKQIAGLEKAVGTQLNLTGVLE